jgi:hypothetical protein
MRPLAVRGGTTRKPSSCGKGGLRSKLGLVAGVMQTSGNGIKILGVPGGATGKSGRRGASESTL